MRICKVVTGPTHDDPYVGPALPYIDKALTWAEESDVNVVLDLHAAPGGQSGERPAGINKPSPLTIYNITLRTQF